METNKKGQKSKQLESQKNDFILNVTVRSNHLKKSDVLVNNFKSHLHVKNQLDTVLSDWNCW